MPVNHIRYEPRSRLLRMATKSTLPEILWENVRALMLSKWGAENLNRLARESRIGLASTTRIKEARTSVGLGIIEKVARTLGAEPWQLIAPGLSDEKFLDILRAWQQTDGRGKRMLLSAAEGAVADDGERPERPATARNAR